MGQRWKNLSFRLPAFILLASLVPLAGFGLFAIDYSKTVLLETQGRATRRTALLAAELVDQHLTEMQMDLQTDAENLDLLALAPDDQEWALLTILRQHTTIKEVTLINPSGVEQMRVGEDHVFLPDELSNQSENPVFREAMQGKPYIGDPQIHTGEHANSGYLSHLGVPLIDPATQSVAAVLLVDLSLRESLGEITDIRIGRSGSVYVIDARGRILAHADASLVLAEATLPIAKLLADSAVDGAAPVQTFKNIDGVEVQGAIVPLAETGWMVVGERPVAGILGDLKEQSQLLQILLGALVLFLLPLIYLFFRGTVVPLQLLERGAEEIGAGRFGTSIPVRNDDEIGRVSGAFNRMAENLKQMTEERERVSWLKNGLSGLDNQLRGVLEVEDVARTAASYLAQYVGAPVAALYVSNGKDRFSLAAGFANEGSNPAKQDFALGQGLVGQVAFERKVMVLNQVPDHYLDVSSGLGSAPSQALLLLPLIYNEELLGVIEFGAFEPFTKQNRIFLEQASGPLAIALGGARARTLLRESLSKSQRFAEELQAQQEELQASNEELEEQTQLLKASEEELQAQQEELQAANEELEEKSFSLQQQQDLLSEKNMALELTQERLEQHARELQVTSRYKSEFLANMSHELRTPLNSLLILSQDLASNSQGNLSAGQIESAEVIQSSGNDLLRLINEILDLSKIESGKMELNFDKIDVADLQQSLQKTFQHMAQVKGLDFAVMLEEGAPLLLHSDAQRLNQILKNLVSNALKFTTHGQVKLSIGIPPDNAILTRHEFDVASWCALSVSDTGIGIAPDKLEDIFGAFQQVDGSISRQYGGTGLGLTISRELAGLLGGELRVVSRLGEGSTFTLYLPLDCSKEAPAPRLAEKPPMVEKLAYAPEQPLQKRPVSPSIADDRDTLSGDDRVILIVEDDLKFARIMANLCHEKGFSYLHAGDGETGLQLVQDYLPLAVLLDIRLPGMHGLELLEILKSRADLRHIPVHMISVEDRAQESLRLGAAGFLSKPTNKNELMQVLVRLEGLVSGKLKKLLIIDDDSDQRRSIMQLIGNGDVECLEAATGSAALETLATGQVDCMILDLGLPDMTGLELLSQLEKLTVAVPPVIVYTGRDLSRDEEAALNEYTASIIIKGIKSPERLLDEASLFLHRVVAKLPAHKQLMIAGLHDGDRWSQDQKILLVDDDMRNVFALAKVLEQKGLIVVKASDGEKALAALENQPDIDLVLMDIMMPVMDGYEAMRRIRQQPCFAKLPILALTAKAMQEDRGKCIEAGANDYLSKPIDVPKLLSLLRVWLHRR